MGSGQQNQRGKQQQGGAARVGSAHPPQQEGSPQAAAVVIRQLLRLLVPSQLHLVAAAIGVTMPVSILSSWGTSTQLHLEQLFLGSINELHYGASKIWLIAPTCSAAKRFERLVVEKYGSLQPLFDKRLALQDVSVLQMVKECGFEVVVQKQGDIIITFPGCTTHVTVSTGPSLATAANCFFDGEQWQLLPHLVRSAELLKQKKGDLIPQHRKVLVTSGLGQDEDNCVGLLQLHVAAEVLPLLFSQNKEVAEAVLAKAAAAAELEGLAVSAGLTSSSPTNPSSAAPAAAAVGGLVGSSGASSAPNASSSAAAAAAGSTSRSGPGGSGSSIGSASSDAAAEEVWQKLLSRLRERHSQMAQLKLLVDGPPKK
jgi:hypothetical protein